MRNPNTVLFWNKKILDEEGVLLQSPIYLDKNNIVARYLSGFSGKLLNIGLGYGVLEGLLKNRARRLELFGIDISPVAVKKVKKSIHGKFIVASALKIPFKNGFFDYATALDVLEHFRVGELAKVLIEVKRVLKDKGLFIVSVPLNELEKDKELNRHMVSFTKFRILKMLSKNGFKIKGTKLLYAFKSGYFIKSLLVRILKLRQPNLAIIFAKKK